MPRNAERSAATRARLTGVARALFAREGYAATGTEAILQGAGVRRGAMYHHFADKAALFEAVCMELSEEALPEVDAAVSTTDEPLEMLVRGSIAWITFTIRPEVRRILLVDAPTVLGWERWDALDRRLRAQALRVRVEAVVDVRVLPDACLRAGRATGPEEEGGSEEGSDDRCLHRTLDVRDRREVPR